MRIVRRAPTKLIMCGEHYVVYGAPAMAVPSSLENEVRLREVEGSGFEIISGKRRASADEGGKVAGDRMLANFLQLFWSLTPKLKRGVKLEAKFINHGAIKGMGNSASFATALARCLLRYSRRKMTQEELF